MNDWIRRAAWLAFAAVLAFGLGLSTARAQDAPTLQERLDALVKRLHNTTNEYYEKNWKNDLTEEQQREVEAKRPGLEFVPEFEALATEAKGTDVCASARMQVFSIQCDFEKKPEAEKTLSRLLSESIDSVALKTLPSTLVYSYRQLTDQERVLAALNTLLEKSPHKEVKASALFSSGQMQCGRKSTEAQKAQGRKAFERLISEFGDVKGNRKSYRESAEAFLFELDHLQIGMVAPDFETVDENGATFKLSDYRGKVVVIDFWGNW